MFLVSAKELGIQGTEEHRIGFFKFTQKRLFDFLGGTKLINFSKVAANLIFFSIISPTNPFQSNNYFGLSTKQG